jgi:RNA polymerase sigma factor for flagellar operon FliA
VSQFEEPELPEGALDETITRQQRRRLQRAIQRLPDRQQRALTLTLLEGMRPRHVSEVMGISPARVSQLQKRAVVTVRRVMRQRCCMSIPPASPREKVIR